MDDVCITLYEMIGCGYVQYISDIEILVHTLQGVRMFRAKSVCRTCMCALTFSTSQPSRRR